VFVRFDYVASFIGTAHNRRVKYWEIIADRLSKAGWSLGWVSAIDSNGRMIWIADAHRDDGKRFVVRADDQLSAFVELESAIHHRLEQRASAQAPSTNAVREETRPSKLVLRKRRNEVHLDSGVLRLARK
jgi:hypothetical protein